MERRKTIEAIKYLDKVKKIIKESGPKYSREILLGGIEKGRWSSNKYANVALDHLFNLGEIGIAKKNGTQKQYDINKNLISKTYIEKKDKFNNECEFYKWYIIRRIRSIGLLWNRNGGAWSGHFISNKNFRSNIIEMLVEEGILRKIMIQGIKEIFYIHKDDLDELFEERSNKKTVKFLAPLDNLLWDRDMVYEIFDFRYSWEVYIPKEKRKYGYYVIPVLYGNDIIARFEPMKDNKNGKFNISNWWWEEGVIISEKCISEIMKAFNLFGVFLKRKIKFESILKKINYVNPYKKCPVLETDLFVLRLVEKNDAKDLLECYSDKKALKIFNRDNCPSNFYVETKDKMIELIKFWILEYNEGRYVRFSIIEKIQNKAIGTIEIFAQNENYNDYGKVGVLRIDLSSTFENKKTLNNILTLVLNDFGELFKINSIITKANEFASTRRKILNDLGFQNVNKKQIINYDDYFIFFNTKTSI